MYYTYILTNISHTVLYTGVTRNLIRRSFEHESKFVDSFTKKYGVAELIYYEAHSSVLSAIKREKQIKRWHRSWKERLISQFNPRWRDLSENLGVSLE